MTPSTSLPTPGTSWSPLSRKIRGKKESDREPTEDLAAGNAGCHGKVYDCRLAIGRQDEAPVGSRCVAVDGRGRSQLAGLAGHCRRATRAARPVAEDQERYTAEAIPGHSTAGHGRFESVSGSVEDDVRQDAGLSTNACSGLHRPGTGEVVRAPDRCLEDDLHRLQQIGEYSRTQHFQAVFLRAD